MGLALSTAQLDEYDRRGCVILRSFFDSGTVDSLRRAAIEVLCNIAPGTRGVGFHPGPKKPGDEINPNRVNYLNDIHLMHPSFDAHMRRKEFAEVFLDLYCCDVMAFQAASVIKTPDFSFEFQGWHQDAPDYTPLTNYKLASVLTYLSADMGPDTGGTSFVPGSHRLGLFERKYIAVEGFPVRKRLLDGFEKFEHLVESPQFHPGDVLLFHPCLIHVANTNRTNESKIGLINAYRGSECIDLTERNTFNADNIAITRNKRHLDLTQPAG